MLGTEWFTYFPNSNLFWMNNSLLHLEFSRECATGNTRQFEESVQMAVSTGSVSAVCAGVRRSLPGWLFEGNHAEYSFCICVKNKNKKM